MFRWRRVLRTAAVLAAAAFSWAGTSATDPVCRDTLEQSVSALKSTELRATVQQEADSLQLPVSIVLSMIAVESAFRSEAVSPAGARGLLQVTQPALLDVVALYGLPLVPITSMHHPRTGVRYGVYYLLHWMTLTGSVRESLIGYNGGYRQWYRYKNGQPLARETANYVTRVLAIQAIHCSPTGQGE